MHDCFSPLSGLHFLHIGEARTSFSLHSVDTVRHAPAHLHAFVTATQQAAPQALIVLMTNHAICDEKYRGEYRQWVHLARTNPSVFCADYLRVGRELGDERTTSECLHSLLANEGVESLNERLTQALGERGISTQHAGPVILDAFAITRDQCAYTDDKDGRHYLPLVPTELLTLLRCRSEVRVETLLQKAEEEIDEVRSMLHRV